LGGVPNGIYEVTVEGLGKTISKTLRIVGNEECSVFFNLITGEVQHAPLVADQILLEVDGSELPIASDLVGYLSNRVRVTCYCVDASLGFTGATSLSITDLSSNVRSAESRAGKFEFFEPQVGSDRIVFEYRGRLFGSGTPPADSLTLAAELRQSTGATVSRQFVIPVYYSRSKAIRDFEESRESAVRVKPVGGRRAGVVAVGDDYANVKATLGIIKKQVWSTGVNQLGPGVHFYYKRHGLLITFDVQSNKVIRIGRYSGE
jgi:hypothetical protein